MKDPVTGNPEQISIIKDVTEVKKCSKGGKNEQEQLYGSPAKKKETEPLSKKAITYSHRSKLLMITEMVGFQSINLAGPALCRS